MIKDFKYGERVTNKSYYLAYDDGHNNGFGFPCDKNGNVIIRDDNDAAKENYQYCLTHKDKFVRAGEIIEDVWTYRENNSGTCECGERIELYDQYLGACECPRCGRWYNISGQELNNPETWSNGEDW